MRPTRAVKDSPSSAPRPRGRPRSLEARRAVLRAAHALLKEGGVSALTIEGIAARAGVGKPTIYRSWPNAHAVAMAALMEGLEAPAAPQRPAASAMAALRAQLREVAQVFSTPLGRNVTLMIASAESETELSKAFRNHVILARRNEGRRLLETAIENGELRDNLDIEVALDLIYAPVFYRLLMGHAPLDAAFTDGVIRHVLEGLAARRAQARGARTVSSRKT
ncbi:MAG: TetR/AcrR family transcriptional regulator [Gammaproteobacteria bacterium]|nr:MAG: TetR/AcrR family transcriptional regulator [Gammaproteobacteria bacterium]